MRVATEKKRGTMPLWVMAWTTAVLLGTVSAPGAESTLIKVALVTPEGSAWTDALRDMAEEVSRQTGGRVGFRIYPGGVSGDEMDVLRKMQVNRIQAAGLSGVGLGVLLPAIRILEAPLLYRDYGEIDRVKDVLFDDFAAGFEESGFVLLGFAEGGFVYFFSQSDISTPEGLKAAKMWAWKGDPVATVFLETFGINAVPLHVADVNIGLETGMISAFYAPPLAAVAFQWHTKVSYLLDYPMVNSTCALVIRKQTFDRLSAEEQTVLKSSAATYCRRLVDITREQNAEALRAMTAAGLVPLTPSGAQIRSFEENAHKTYQKHVPSLYSRELLDRVRQILAAIRSGRQPSP
jgi:TRAP-type C4-dicarboxylate transport system substrate-binding protein